MLKVRSDGLRSSIHPTRAAQARPATASRMNLVRVSNLEPHAVMLGGLALAVLRRLPNEGESFVEQGWRFEIVDMDGRKIDKLLVSQV